MPPTHRFQRLTNQPINMNKNVKSIAGRKPEAFVRADLENDLASYALVDGRWYSINGTEDRVAEVRWDVTPGSPLHKTLNDKWKSQAKQGLGRTKRVTGTTLTPKHQRGTIGAAIAKLVKRYGSYSSGLYILESACAQAHGAERVSFTIGLDRDLLACETPRYKVVHAEEDAILARLRKEGVIS